MGGGGAKGGWAGLNWVILWGEASEAQPRSAVFPGRHLGQYSVVSRPQPPACPPARRPREGRGLRNRMLCPPSAPSIASQSSLFGPCWALGTTEGSVLGSIHSSIQSADTIEHWDAAMNQVIKSSLSWSRSSAGETDKNRTDTQHNAKAKRIIQRVIKK